MALVVLGSLEGLASEGPPPEITAAGTAALRKFLPIVVRKTSTHRIELGFSPEDELSDLKLGEPFQPQVLVSDLNYNSKRKLEEYFANSNRWYFPVISRGQVVCLLTLAPQPAGKWIEESIGMCELARAWAAVCQAWPASSGYTPILIFAPIQRQILFTVPQASPSPNLTRLSLNESEKNPPLKKAEETLLRLLASRTSNSSNPPSPSPPPRPPRPPSPQVPSSR